MQNFPLFSLIFDFYLSYLRLTVNIRCTHSEKHRHKISVYHPFATIFVN